jgi:hypothetical protein
VAGVNKSTVSRWRESLLPNMRCCWHPISNRTQEGEFRLNIKTAS